MLARRCRFICRFQTNRAVAMEPRDVDWQRARRFEHIPSIQKLSLTLDMSFPGGKYKNLDLSQLMMALRRDYGDIYRMPSLFGSEPMVITYSPRDFEEVYRHEGVWPSRPGNDTMRYHRLTHRKDFFQGCQGLIAQGKEWGEFRSIVNPVLMQPKNVRVYYKKMSQVNMEFVQLIKAKRDLKTLEMADNFIEDINRWTLESVSVVALDKQLGLLKGGSKDEQTQLLFKSLDEFFRYGGTLDVKPSLWRYIKTPMFKKLMKAYDNIQITTLAFVNEALERLERESQQGLVRPELLKKNKQVATIMAMDLMLAGVDTTSSAFTAALLCLASNPEKQEKLREEVMLVLPNMDSEFTEASMMNVPYLRACLKESQRMRPLAITHARKLEQNCVLSGYKVPADTTVMMVPIPALSSEQYFPRATEFLPERWLRNEEKAECPALRTTYPFAYLPFGFGARMCAGKRIVDMELELGIARIIRNFKVEFNYSTENAFTAVMFNKPNIPLKFKFTDLNK